MREAITARMKVLCLLHRADVFCAICDGRIDPEQDIEWDHVWALCHGGPHTFDNIRPLHAACHVEKTRADVKANAKVKRIAKKRAKVDVQDFGEMELKPMRPKKKIPSRPFPKRAA